MATKEIWHQIRIKASEAAVFAALTDPKKLAQWWIPDTRGESKVGGTLEFWLGDNCQPMEVATLEPNKLVRWLAPKMGMDDWTGTEVKFRIYSKSDHTYIDFRHSGLRPDVELIPYYSMSWAVFLLSLKELLEKGKGFPFPNQWIYQ